MCPVPVTPYVDDFSLTFPPDPLWVRIAREAVRTAVRGAEAVKDDLAEIAALLTSEVVTNAVAAAAHALAPGPVGLRAGWTGCGEMRVYVRDEGPGLPEQPAGVPGAADEHGRGLLLLGMQAAEWGVCRHAPGRGKAVWFALR